MSARRSKFQLSVEVLSQIKQGERKPTRIMYSANLSWKSLKEILDSLVSQGLIEEELVGRSSKRAKKRYEITSKGENVLEYYNVVSGLIEIEPVGRSSKRAKKRYEITSKGENVLEYYNVVSGLIEIEPSTT